MKLSPWLLCSCLMYVFSFIKRTIFRFRRRRSSDPSLPTKGSGSGGGGGPSSSVNGSSAKNYGNTSGVDLAWDDWGDGSTMSIKIDPTTPTVAPSNQTVPPSLSNPENEEEEEHVDYFADMTPRYKKPATIRKKTQMIPGPSSLTQGLSNRLTLGIDETAVLTDELGAWSENDNGWGEEAVDDLAWEADQVIREKKQAEREKRAAEQRRKKMEREAQRVMKKDTGKLATKLK